MQATILIHLPISQTPLLLPLLVNMAKYSNVASALTVFLILSLILSMSSQARILEKERDMQKNSESQLLLFELGFDLHKLKHYEKMSARRPGSDRVSPAGPDPHHHF